MKQLLFFIVIGFLIGAGGVWGRYAAFDKPESFLITLRQAKQLPEGIPVWVRGRITTQIGPNLYLFADRHDSAAVHILPQQWNGLWVQPVGRLKNMKKECFRCFFFKNFYLICCLKGIRR